MQISNVAAEHSNADHARQQAFVHFHCLKARFRPNLTVRPAAFHAEASEARYRRRLMHKFFEAQPRKCRSVCRNCKQRKPRQEQNPQESPPLHKAHFS
jgi:hypothetical protein